MRDGVFGGTYHNYLEALSKNTALIVITTTNNNNNNRNDNNNSKIYTLTNDIKYFCMF